MDLSTQLSIMNMLRLGFVLIVLITGLIYAVKAGNKLLTMGNPNRDIANLHFVLLFGVVMLSGIMKGITSLNHEGFGLMLLITLAISIASGIHDIV